MRDVLDCRSPARCASCEHRVGGSGCALEVAIADATRPRLAVRAAPSHTSGALKAAV